MSKLRYSPLILNSKVEYSTEPLPSKLSLYTIFTKSIGILKIYVEFYNFSICAIQTRSYIIEHTYSAGYKIITNQSHDDAYCLVVSPIDKRIIHFDRHTMHFSETIIADSHDTNFLKCLNSHESSIVKLDENRFLIHNECIYIVKNGIINPLKHIFDYICSIPTAIKYIKIEYVLKTRTGELFTVRAIIDGIDTHMLLESDRDVIVNMIYLHNSHTAGTVVVYKRKYICISDFSGCTIYKFTLNKVFRTYTWRELTQLLYQPPHIYYISDDFIIYSYTNETDGKIQYSNCALDMRTNCVYTYNPCTTVHTIAKRINRITLYLQPNVYNYNCRESCRLYLPVHIPNIRDELFDCVNN